MVKPSKSMQPESIDLSKAGRGSSRSFQEDSFHKYIGRKIDLQRQQFGHSSVGLPPPPPSPPRPPTSVMTSPLRLASPLKSSLASPLSTEVNSNKKSHSVRFAKVENADTIIHSSSETITRLRKRPRKNSKTEITEMGSIIQGLKQRHPKLSKKVAGRRKRKRIKANEKRLQRIIGRTPLLEILQEEEEEEQQQEEAQSNHNASETVCGSKHPETNDITSIEHHASYDGPDVRTKIQSDPDSYFEATEILSHSSKKSINRSTRPDLFFQGITIKVNGYTNPESECLQRLVLQHGGALESYETDMVTHIIAENLSTAKGDAFKRQKNPRPVVYPSWIVDCVTQQRLLPHGDYLVKEVRDKSQTKGIREMFATNSKKANPKQADPLERDAYNENQVELKDNGQAAGVTNEKYINGKIRTVGTDPNFLDTFFRESRLSFIGSYKQRVMSSPSKASRKDMDHLDRFVFHVDMDCFFASVVLRKYPQYRDKPVVICHSGKRKEGIEQSRQYDLKSSTSECATCNYEARKYGIKKGMFFGTAKQLCPELIALPYEMQEYHEVSEQVAEILQQVAEEHYGAVEIVSCDEAYLELMLGGNEQAKAIAEKIRSTIFDVTECTASVGIAKNKLLAKLGTDTVKPNGSFLVKDHKVLLKNLKLRNLPGIGNKTERKLSEQGLVSVQDIIGLQTSGTDVCSILSGILGGTKTGKKIFDFCQGRDDRKVEPAERKTISAECNYGVRFNGEYGIDHFMMKLAKEVQKRMDGVGVKGHRVTLKAKRRKQGAKPPGKFLGHGSCHNFSKSMNIPGPVATSDASLISECGLNLFKELKIPLDDLRGMGIVLSKLTVANRKEEPASRLTNWFKAASKNGHSHCESAVDESSDLQQSNYSLTVDEADDDIIQISSNPNSDEEIDQKEMASNPAALTQIALPPMSQIRMSQVEQLPVEMQHQIQAQIHESKESKEFADKDVIFIDDQRNESSKMLPKQSKSHINRKHRLQQTSMTQIFELAKSGANATGIPAQEWQQLPLQTKIEAMNGCKTAFSIENPDLVSKQNTAQDCQVKTCVKPPNESISDEINSSKHINEQNTFPDSVKKVCYKERPVNFYEEDILPLNLFLDENPCHDPNAVKLVTKFLKICLKEGRSKDMMTLLHSIQTRNDSWSGDAILKKITVDLDLEYYRLHGARLDFDRIMKKR